jgi:hypothetical protein
MNSSFGTKRVHVSEETVTHGHLYDDYVKTLKPNTMTSHRLTAEDKAQYGEMVKGGRKPGPAMTDGAVWMFGKDLKGMNVNFCWVFCQPVCGPRSCSGGTYIRWMKSNFAAPNLRTLIAVAEIQMIWDLNMKGASSIADGCLCPWRPHNPIVTRWVGKPYAFL